MLPPTCTIEIPPTNLAKRSCNFSFSNGVFANSICSINSLIRASILVSSPLPSTIVVVSLEIVTERAWPNQLESNFSNFIPFSAEITCPPVKIAMSSKINFLLSPKSGALTAADFKIPLALFTISAANASPSISSAITKIDLFC